MWVVESQLHIPSKERMRFTCKHSGRLVTLKFVVGHYTPLAMSVTYQQSAVEKRGCLHISWIWVMATITYCFGKILRSLAALLLQGTQRLSFFACSCRAGDFRCTNSGSWALTKLERKGWNSFPTESRRHPAPGAQCTANQHSTTPQGHAERGGDPSPNLLDSAAWDRGPYEGWPSEAKVPSGLLIIAGLWPQLSHSSVSSFAKLPCYSLALEYPRKVHKVRTSFCTALTEKGRA